MLIAGVGIFLSIAGIYMVRTEEDASQKTLLAALARGINFSTVLIMFASVVLTYWLLGQRTLADFAERDRRSGGWLDYRQMDRVLHEQRIPADHRTWPIKR